MKNYRNTLLLIIFVAVFLLLLFTINQDVPAQVDRPVQVVNREKESVDTFRSDLIVMVPDETICEGCHLSGKPYVPQADKVEPHINGGKYCLNCHKITHEVHPSNENVTCEKCHGTIASIPSYKNGYISCNDCHNYPDPLLPSKGSILSIHKPRGVTCNTCHTDTCTNCHLEERTNERWDKRIGHFSTVSRMR